DRDAGHRRPGLVSGVAHRGDVGGRRRRGRRRNSIAGQPLRPGVGGLDGRGGQRARRARRRVDRRPSRVVRRRGRGVVLRRRDVLGGGRRRRPDRRRGGAVGRGRPAGGAGAERGGRGRGAGDRGGRRAGRAAGDPAAPAVAGPGGGRPGRGGHGGRPPPRHWPRWAPTRSGWRVARTSTLTRHRCGICARPTTAPARAGPPRPSGTATGCPNASAPRCTPWAPPTTCRTGRSPGPWPPPPTRSPPPPGAVGTFSSAPVR